jgi:DNA-directed RNA polymerase subunit K/omega
MADINIETYEIEDDSDNQIPQDIYNDNVDILKNYDILKNNNKSSNRMTSKEKTKIIGIRAQQLACNAKSTVDFPKYLTNSLDRAEYEFNLKKTPFIVKRLFADRYEYWKLEDMIYPNL